MGNGLIKIPEAVWVFCTALTLIFTHCTCVH